MQRERWTLNKTIGFENMMPYISFIDWIYSFIPRFMYVFNYKDTPVAFFYFSPLCVFKCFLKSPTRDERMHNHIGCICLTFLHRVFWNVSLNGMPEKMHSCIGRTCVVFLCCVFSNGPLNSLLQKMHSNIGHICLTFLQCVFSNVSSKLPPKRMQSHTGCICLTFLCYVLSYVPPKRLSESM